jgi:hypothetical protein
VNATILRSIKFKKNLTMKKINIVKKSEIRTNKAQKPHEQNKNIINKKTCERNKKQNKQNKILMYAKQ